MKAAQQDPNASLVDIMLETYTWAHNLTDVQVERLYELERKCQDLRIEQRASKLYFAAYRRQSKNSVEVEAAPAVPEQAEVSEVASPLLALGDFSCQPFAKLRRSWCMKHLCEIVLCHASVLCHLTRACV